MNGVAQVSPTVPSAPSAPITSPQQGRRVLLGMILGVLVTVIVIGVTPLRHRWIPKRWGTVVPGVVFRSGQIYGPLIVPTFREYGIRTIVCMTSPDAKDEDQQAELLAAQDMGIEHVFLPLNGKGVGKVEHYTQAVRKVAECARDHEPVLVHCHAGTQRTGGIVATYRLLVEGRSPEAVIDELKYYGWNPRRDRVLIDYLNQNLRAAAVELVAAGCLKQVPDPLPVLR